MNPLNQATVPTNARAIVDRVNEVTFNATLVQEIEAIDAINELKAIDDDARSAYKRVHLHEIKDEPHLARLHYTSKFDTDWGLLLKLRGYGRAAAQRWLETCVGQLGTRSTADMRAMLRCLESD